MLMTKAAERAVKGLMLSPLAVRVCPMTPLTMADAYHCQQTARIRYSRGGRLYRGERIRADRSAGREVVLMMGGKSGMLGEITRKMGDCLFICAGG